MGNVIIVHHDLPGSFSYIKVSDSLLNNRSLLTDRINQHLVSIDLKKNTSVYEVVKSAKGYNVS